MAEISCRNYLEGVVQRVGTKGMNPLDCNEESFVWPEGNHIRTVDVMMLNSMLMDQNKKLMELLRLRDEEWQLV